MRKQIAAFTLIIFLLVPVSTYSQWAAGLSANLKNDNPQKGIGFTISRALPFQFPLAGFRIRIDGILFDQTIRRPTTTLSEKNVHVSLEGILFLKLFQPYAMISAGYGWLKANDNHKGSFLTGSAAGLQFAVFHPVYPYLEARAVQYIEPLSKGVSNAKDFQITGALGVKIEF